MAIEIVMPRLGWTAETAVLKEWLVRHGDAIEIGDALFSVEGDKAVEEIEALDPGILHIPPESPPPGQSAPVGTLLAYILTPGEDPPASVSPTAVTASDTPPAAGPTPPPSTAASPTPPRKIAISPRARKLARDLDLDWTQVEGSGRSGRIVEKDIRAAHDALGKISLSPVAQRLAQELGIAAAALAQAFPGQRISAAMVRGLAASPDAPLPEGQVIPFDNTRQTIADRLSASWRQSVPVTLMAEMDATELVNLRQQLQADGRTRVPSYNALFMKILAHALAEHPALNGHVEENAVRLFDPINISFAVNAEQGLATPVVRAVHRKRLEEIHKEARDLAERAQAKTLRAQDMQGGTFTLTNLGAWNVDAFTPILNPPQIGILGIGRIQAKPVVVDEGRQAIAARPCLTLNFTFDHRAVDGAPAAQFLDRVKQFAEQPYLWLTL